MISDFITIAERKHPDMFKAGLILFVNDAPLLTRLHRVGTEVVSEILTPFSETVLEWFSITGITPCRLFLGDYHETIRVAFKDEVEATLFKLAFSLD